MILASAGTDAIAIVALVIATLSLGWQAASFLLTGPRIRVRIAEGLRDPRDNSVMIGPLSNYTDDAAKSLLARGYEHVVGVGVVNIGRLPATVTSWSIGVGGSAAIYTNANDPRNPPAKCRLESSDPQWWWADADGIKSLISRVSESRDGVIAARARVDVAGRATLESKNELRLVDGRFESNEPGLAHRLARGVKKRLR